MIKHKFHHFTVIFILAISFCLQAKADVPRRPDHFGRYQYKTTPSFAAFLINALKFGDHDTVTAESSGISLQPSDEKKDKLPNSAIENVITCASDTGEADCTLETIHSLPKEDLSAWLKNIFSVTTKDGDENKKLSTLNILTPGLSKVLWKHASFQTSEAVEINDGSVWAPCEMTKKTLSGTIGDQEYQLICRSRSTSSCFYKYDPGCRVIVSGPKKETFVEFIKMQPIVPEKD
ncbi:MAG: hypothetical protein KDK51_04800 [Deltaproteobacteria bacterium]|nr:hypothetical protein [Deltaproteobacteria bacterium]